MKKDCLRSIVGENVRIERMARDIPIDVLSEMLNLSPGFVGLIERGQRGASSLTLYKLSTIFGLPVDALFYPRTSKAITLKEDTEDLTKTSGHKEIEDMISDFSDKELDFLISMLKNIRTMNRSSTGDDEEEDV